MSDSSVPWEERPAERVRRPPTSRPRGRGTARERRTTVVAAEPRRRPSGLTRSLMGLIALLVAGGVVGVLLVVVLARPASYTTSPQILISPGGDLTASEVTSFYEALSRGQITATAAAVLDQPNVLRDAADRAGVDPAQVSLTVSVVPETTLVRMEVRAPSGEDAEAVAGRLVRDARAEISDLLPAFDVTPLGDGVPPASRSGVTTFEVAAAAGATGVVVFLAVYVSLLSLWRARQRRLL